MKLDQRTLTWMMSFLFAFAAVVNADSPITSTNFYQAYLDVPEVSSFADSPMDRDIYEILRTDGYPLDIKVAVINAMGWTMEGQDNAEVFMEYYMVDEGSNDIEPGDMTGEELVCLAYMVAMDDYFTMGPIKKSGEGVLGMSGPELARLAKERMPENFAAQMICALVLSQEAFDRDWGEVYAIVDQVMNEPLDRNMRWDAVDIIVEYIDLYSGY